MYINGVVLRTDTGKNYPNTISRVNAWLGRSSGNDNPFNGYMDEFRIYKTVLSADDVTALYNAIEPSFPSPQPTAAPTAAPTAVPTAAPTLVPTAVPTVAPTMFSLDTLSSLTHYYRFDHDDIQGVSVLNYKTNQYDAELVNGATLSSSAGTFKGGNGALSLVSTGDATTSPYFRITNGIMLGSTGISFAIWFRSISSGTWARLFEFGNGAPSDNVLVSVSRYTKLGYEVYKGTDQKYVDTTLNVDDNTWRHLVSLHYHQQQLLLLLIHHQ